MSGDTGRQAPHDPAARGFDGRTLSPADPPAPGEPPSPEWLAQVGRAPISDYAGGREVMKRLTEGGLAVPGDDPLYQYLGAQRMFVEVLQAQQDDQMARMRAMLDEARLGLAQLLADTGVAAAAALAARRAEDEAALKRFSAEVVGQTTNAAAKLRAAMAEERELFTAAVAVKVAEGVARIDSEKAIRAGHRRLWRPLGSLVPAWAVRGRAAAAWAALLAVSVIAGLALLWVLGRFGPGHGGR